MGTFFGPVLALCHLRRKRAHQGRDTIFPGHRGCRLGIAYPEITETQACAIFEAAAEVQKKGIRVKPEIMIPLVGYKKELDLQVAIVHRVAAEVQAEKKVKLSYQVGTMIEVPRGALTADEIAQTAECRRHGAAILPKSYGSIPQLRHERPQADRARHLPPIFESKMGRLSRCASVRATTWVTS